MFVGAEGEPVALPDPDLDAAATLSVLATGDVEIIGRMPFSSNGTYLCVVGGGDTALSAIYKPGDDERPLWDFPEGTLYRREVASYALSDALGWDIVPCTVSRDDAPLGPGSLQHFITHDPAEHYFTLLEGNEERFHQFAAFDVVANNTDRKGGHCLRALRDNRIVGIDHGLTFHMSWKLRTVIWDFAGEELPEDLREDLARVLGEVPQLLAPLLTPIEVDATSTRLRALIAEGTYPEPTDDYRSYPWPLV